MIPLALSDNFFGKAARDRKRFAATLLASVLLGGAILSGCAGATTSASNGHRHHSVTITVSPANATVTPGSTQQFSATVTGTSNMAVTWAVSGVGCSGATCGTISSSGIYSSPANLSSSLTVTVQATLVADPTKSASATVTIVAVAVLLSISPASASVPASGTQSFIATVTGAANTAVTWSLSGPGCSGSSCGTLSTSSLSAVYAAPSVPPSPPQVSVIATSVADPSQSASATMTIVTAVPVSLSISPASATVPTGGTQSLLATVTGTSNTAVTWSLSGPGCSGSSCGTLSTNSLSATYVAPSAPPSPANVSVIATSVADPTKSTSASITVLPNVLVIVTPADVSVPAGTTEQFNAAVTGTANTVVTWTVSGAGCSGAACGAIDSSGLYTAPAADPSPPTVTVTATSSADPTKSGSANITLAAATSVTVSVQPNGSTTTPFSPLRLLPGATKRLYANVCNGTNAPDCTRPASITTSWSTTCGSLSASSGPYVNYTAPASGGPCTITATSNGANARATATLASPTVLIDVIPAAITLYTNQTTLVQAVVVGSVNRGVSWSLTTNPGGAGTLIAQGWTATFSATAAGTYTATATSSADSTKSGVITFYVTANAMPTTATANHTEPVDCTATGSGTTYEVGPARAYRTINAVPWYSLNPGDTVRIHNDGTAGNPTVYREKWDIRRSGTASQPIRICGVPGGAGNELPLISGDGATTGAGMDYGSLESYGTILIYDHTANQARYGTKNYPQYITIEGLAIQHVTGSFNYVPQAGGTAAWQQYSSSVWMQHGAHVTLRGLDVEDTAETLFINSQNSLGETTMSRWLLIQGNYIGNNGVPAVDRRHQTYAQAFGQVIQGNYYDEPKSGMLGSQVKTRCVICFIRYNFVVGINAGARIFDVVSPENSNTFVLTQEWYRSSEPNIGVDDVAAYEDWFGTDYIYGNIVKFQAASGAFHYADDNCYEDSHGGTLYMYHNTIWAAQPAGSPNWRWYAFDSGPAAAPCFSTMPETRYPQSEFTNNAILLSSTGPEYFYWSRIWPGFVTLDTNWISTGWGSGTGQGTDGDGTAYDGTGVNQYQTGNDAHHVTGMNNLITGTGSPFDPSTCIPVSGSPLVGTATPLPTVVSSALPVTMQYNPTTYLMTPRASTSDIGAVSH
jgi:hypothetical protein